MQLLGFFPHKREKNYIMGKPLKKEGIRAEQIRMIDVTQDNMYESLCCGIKNTEHKGYKRNAAWLNTYQFHHERYDWIVRVKGHSNLIVRA